MGGDAERERRRTNEGGVFLIHQDALVVPGENVQAEEAVALVDLGTRLLSQLHETVLGHALGQKLPVDGQEAVDVGLGHVELRILPLLQELPHGGTPLAEHSRDFVQHRVMLLSRRRRKRKRKRKWF